MNDIEGLWALRFGDFDDPSDKNAGVVVFMRSKILGGDARFHYVGEFEASDDTVTIHATVTHFDGSDRNAFGLPVAGPLRVAFEGRRDGDRIRGRMWPEDDPGKPAQVSLRRLEDLP